uniref:Uncharacterized protein n=1 Tax=Fagus sylvatica TaxID=28930 RepID=A0A2N9J3A8_FAGSY
MASSSEVLDLCCRHGFGVGWVAGVGVGLLLVVLPAWVCGFDGGAAGVGVGLMVVLSGVGVNSDLQTEIRWAWAVGHLQAAGFAVGYLQTGRDPARQPQAAALPWVTSRPAALAVGQLQSVHCGHGKPPVQAGVALSVAKPPDLLQAVDHLQPWVMDGGTTAGTNLREKKKKNS